VSVTHSLPSYNKHNKVNKIPPKTAVLSSAATISWGDTSIAESLDVDLILIIRGQLQIVID